MKLRKNDYIDLRKAGRKAIAAKLAELQDALSQSLVSKMKNELKNMKEQKNLKNAISKLKTIEHALRGHK